MDLKYFAWQESLGEQVTGGSEQHLSTGFHMSHMSHVTCHTCHSCHICKKGDVPTFEHTAFIFVTKQRVLSNPHN